MSLPMESAPTQPWFSNPFKTPVEATGTFSVHSETHKSYTGMVSSQSYSLP